MNFSKVILLIILTCTLSLWAEAPKYSVLDLVELKQGEIPMVPSKVKIAKNAEGKFRFYINGVETPINGAGGVFQAGMLEQFSIVGGNFTRTWGVDSLEAKVTDGESYIDRAWRLGVHVMPGLWIGHERHGFDYDNEEQLKKQREDVREAVRKWKNHPAVVVWGLGNEMEDPASQNPNPKVFQELEILAKIIKEEDPHHPVMTIIAGAHPNKINAVKKYYPSIDILGVNAYGSAGGVGEALKRNGWEKPFSITEFGVRGFWEVGTTSWGAPYEPNSSEKARTYYASHKMVTEINEGSELCMGTFAFLWGWKQEKTSTWFGMYLPTMEKLPQVDAMAKAWSGKWPSNRSPKITRIEAEFSGKRIQADSLFVAKAIASDANGDDIRYDWVVTEESKAHSVGGDKEYVPPSFPALTEQNGKSECVFRSPKKSGAYRLFLTIHDDKGGAATANIPFYVN